MQTDKTIKDWMEQVDAISEELTLMEGEDNPLLIGSVHNNAHDMLTSLKTEMQEVLDTDYFKPTIALNPTDVLK